MEAEIQFILVGALLVLLCIVAGLISTRIGAPLLLVFLGLGMLAGEDGPGGILFSDFRAAFLIGSAALAFILFDGGLRTRFHKFRIALWPSLLLATVGVVVTAGIVALVAVPLLGLNWLQALLIGSVVASTDAAAVFFLLHLHGMALQERVSATLEIESGLNDPMAVFLTVACVELLARGETQLTWSLAADFAIQMGGGGAIGVAGGFALVWIVNRLVLPPGLYPILTASLALILFSGTQLMGGSGFLAIYLAGLILGNRRHRAAQAIERFNDGLAWLSQIAMFLMLGLLVTPTSLVGEFGPAVLVAGTLMVVARPVAVWLCVAPFRFSLREIAFIAWVGLRGAVPIFLATVPVLAGLPGARSLFDLAFVVVLLSLLLQGWTVALAARSLGLELPATPGPASRVEIEVPTRFDRTVTGYVVGERSRAVGHDPDRMLLPRRTRILSVIRDGAVLDRGAPQSLRAGDYALTVAPPEESAAMDRLFAARPESEAADRASLFGEFAFPGTAPARAVLETYGLVLPPQEVALSVSDLMLRRLGRAPVVGDRIRIDKVELIVRETQDGVIRTVGIELDPEAAAPRGLAALPGLVARLRRRLLRGAGRT